MSTTTRRLTNRSTWLTRSASSSSTTSPRPAITWRGCLASKVTSRSSGLAESGRRAIELAIALEAGHRADGHQHAGHGRDRGDRAALRPGARRLGRDDVGPGRGGLPAPLDAGRSARVPGQAVQLGRADLLDPPDPFRASRRSSSASRSPWCRRTVSAPDRPTWARSSRSSAPRAASAERRSRSTWPSRRHPSSASGRLWSTAHSSSATSASCSTSIPKNKSIADLAPDLEAGLELETIDPFLTVHSSGAKVLLAPPSPGDGRAGHRGRRPQDARDAPPVQRPDRDRRLLVGHVRHDPGDPRRWPM